MYKEETRHKGGQIRRSKEQSAGKLCGVNGVNVVERGIRKGSLDSTPLLILEGGI
jgi:hypothetical protein